MHDILATYNRHPPDGPGRRNAVETRAAAECCDIRIGEAEYILSLHPHLERNIAYARNAYARND